ncbi:hypothetical protein [Paracoccus sp. AK26]|uniref:hypothetical protein n=1 Tax=Paracoccus sp. AK26 TaxID=2589076 RepID=UPI001430540B|nr:hypothetical protein [Paracoccus sp. AK26]
MMAPPPAPATGGLGYSPIPAFWATFAARIAALLVGFMCRSQAEAACRAGNDKDSLGQRLDDACARVEKLGFPLHEANHA